MDSLRLNAPEADVAHKVEMLAKVTEGEGFSIDAECGLRDKLGN
ncbi:MAG: hypothetical protein ACP5SJ_03445 [Candidatus Micrarchaeia archaeon]